MLMIVYFSYSQPMQYLIHNMLTMTSCEVAHVVTADWAWHLTCLAMEAIPALQTQTIFTVSFTVTRAFTLTPVTIVTPCALTFPIGAIAPFKLTTL